MDTKTKIFMMLFRIGDENIEKIDAHIAKLSDYLTTDADIGMLT